jgi:hypothetical protein
MGREPETATDTATNSYEDRKYRNTPPKSPEPPTRLPRYVTIETRNYPATP